MKQEERNRLKKEKILGAALREFGAKSFAEASVNTICGEDGISKGIIYHYYTDKDELYLACVRECFQAMTGYLAEHMPPLNGTAEEKLTVYFDVRLQFLEEHPNYQGIFYQVTMYTPQHLREKVKQIREPFDRYNLAVLQDVLKGSRLRRHITPADLAALDMLYVIYANSTEQMLSATLEGAAAREELCKHWITVLLYGVVEE